MSKVNNEYIITIGVEVYRDDSKPISKELLQKIKEEILLQCNDGYFELTDPEEDVLDEDNEVISGEEYAIVYEFPM